MSITSTTHAVFNTVAMAHRIHPNRGPKMVSVWRQMAAILEAHPDLPLEMVQLLPAYPVTDVFNVYHAVVDELGVFASGSEISHRMLVALENLDQDCF